MFHLVEIADVGFVPNEVSLDPEKKQMSINGVRQLGHCTAFIGLSLGSGLNLVLAFGY